MGSKRWVVPLALMMFVTACGGDSSSDTTAASGDTFPFERTATTAAGSTETTASATEDAMFERPDGNPSPIDEYSTFALDVDTGSYTLGRAAIEEGRLPHPDSVRIEEFVNFFAQDYPVPDEGFAIVTDGGATPYLDDDSRMLRIGIRAEDVERLGPANLVFVIDTSGSMAEGDKLEIVKDSLAVLVENLHEEDTITIVEFGDEASVALEPTWGDETDDILDALASLQANGSTNFEDGLRLGYRAAQDLFVDDDGAINRVVVASDGVANVGLSDPDSLVGVIREAADEGVRLVTVGVGLDNYNDELLEQLADDGDGFYAYVDTYDEALDLFHRDLMGTLVTVADDARVQVEFDADAVSDWRLVGYDNRGMADEDFRNDSVDAGEIGAGHTVTALYEVELTDLALEGGTERIGRVYLRWLDPETGEPEEISDRIEVDELEERFRDTSDRFQVNVVAARYAEVLRGDAGWWELDDLAGIAEDLARRLEGDDDVAELARLIELAAEL